MLSRLLKLFLSAGVFLCDRLSRQWNHLLGRPVPAHCVFITYHSVTEATHESFARQMAMLKRLARLIPSPADQRLEPGCDYVGVTFDDAFRSFAQYALPVLARLELPVILFVPTGVGEEVLSADELKQLARQYEIEIGSHTVHHPNLVEISQDEVRAELRDSREALEKLLGRKINSISFPYGNCGEREMKLARETGYDFCFTALPQTLAGSIQPGLIGRVDVQPADWGIEFKLKVLGAYRWVTAASAWKHRLKGRSSTAAFMKETKAHG